MTGAIRSCGGTIDKFIGDSVMALWNAPALRAHHAQLACTAILACKSANARLYDSAAWSGLPPLRTRFGVHRDTVMVGHFGAPERFSYTALGDGVNLASRLEACASSMRWMPSSASRWSMPPATISSSAASTAWR